MPDIAMTIRRYIRVHPEAADSIEGICQWWLSPFQHEESRERVEAAVAELVAEGELRQIVLEDGRVIYASGHKR